MMTVVGMLKWRRKRGRNVFIGGDRFQAITRRLAIHSLLHDKDDDGDDDDDEEDNDTFFSVWNVTVGGLVGGWGNCTPGGENSRLILVPFIRANVSIVIIIIIIVPVVDAIIGSNIIIIIVLMRACSQ